MLRKFWGFLILSDADGDVLFRDEIDVTLLTIIDDKLTRVELIHEGMIATGLIIH